MFPLSDFFERVKFSLTHTVTCHTLIFLRMFLVADFYQSFLLNHSPQFKKKTRANPVSSTTISISAFKVKLRDQFRFLGKHPPTPPLRQHFALSEK